MAFTSINSSSWTNKPNTTIGAAGSDGSTTVGAGAGWRDVNGQYNINSGRLTNEAGGPTQSPPKDNVLYRFNTAEKTRNGRVVVYSAQGDRAGGALMRYNPASGGSGYSTLYAFNDLFLWRAYQGVREATRYQVPVGVALPMDPVAVVEFADVDSTHIKFDFKLYAGATFVSADNPGPLLASHTYTDDISGKTDLAMAGFVGIAAWQDQRFKAFAADSAPDTVEPDPDPDPDPEPEPTGIVLSDRYNSRGTQDFSNPTLHSLIITALQARDADAVQAGVNRSVSGATTADWLASVSVDHAAFTAAGTTHVWLTPSINDRKPNSGISVQQSKNNLAALVTARVNAGFKVLLRKEYGIHTGNAFDFGGQAQTNSEQADINDYLPSLANGTTVLYVDVDSIAVTDAIYPGQWHDDLHLNTQGNGTFANALVNSSTLLALVPPPPTPPSVTTQPTNQTGTVGGSATFTATFTGAVTAKAQKLVSSVWTDQGSASLNSTTGVATFTKNNLATADAGSYRLVGTNPNGSKETNAVTLTVNTATSPAVIVRQPLGGSFYVGSRLTLALTFTGDGAVQWKKDGVNLSGETATIFSKIAALGDAGTYTATVGSATTTAAVVTVQAVPATGIDSLTSADLTTLAQAAWTATNRTLTS